MPSTTPSNSRRRTSSTRGTPEAFSASSTTGATTSTAVVGLPPASWIACSDAVLITIAPRLATPAPHADGNASSGGGSASYRWSQRKAATTPRTGTAASAAPVTTPRTPVTRLISAIVRRAQPPVTSTTAAHTSAGGPARGPARRGPHGRAGGSGRRLPGRQAGRHHRAVTAPVADGGHVPHAGQVSAGTRRCGRMRGRTGAYSDRRGWR